MEPFATKSVLVVGGAGFVGSNLVRRLLDAGTGRIVVIDNLLSSDRDNLPTADGLEFVHGSICDDDILQWIQDEFDFAFHLATYHGNQSSIHDPLADHENNTLTTLKLCERLKAFTRLTKMVYASAGCTVADKTFDEATATTEDAPVSLHLDSPYQISKIVGELYGNYYFTRYNLPFVKTRFQNVYGPGEVLGAGRWRGTPATVWRNVIPTFVYRALKQMPLILENNGEATRDFIYVEDLVEGLLRAAVAGEPGEVYNLASGTETSIRQLAARINQQTDNPAEPTEVVDRRAWDRSGRRYGSTLKARRQLDFEAQVPLPEGLARTIAWTRDNLTRIDASIQRHAAHMRSAEHH